MSAARPRLRNTPIQSIGKLPIRGLTLPRNPMGGSTSASAPAGGRSARQTTETESRRRTQTVSGPPNDRSLSMKVLRLSLYLSLEGRRSRLCSPTKSSLTAIFSITATQQALRHARGMDNRTKTVNFVDRRLIINRDAPIFHGRSREKNQPRYHRRN